MASLSRAMRLRSRVTMDSTASRPSRTRRAGARQGRTVDLVGVVRHHHGVQARRQCGRELLHGFRAAIARRQALGR